MTEDTDCLFCRGTGKHNPHRYDNAYPLDRAINESNRYQAMLYQAWQTMRGQAKGLQRQRRLIRRLQARLKVWSAPQPVCARCKSPGHHVSDCEGDTP